MERLIVFFLEKRRNSQYGFHTELPLKTKTESNYKICKYPPIKLDYSESEGEIKWIIALKSAFQMIRTGYSTDNGEIKHESFDAKWQSLQNSNKVCQTDYTDYTLIIVPHLYQLISGVHACVYRMIAARNVQDLDVENIKLDLNEYLFIYEIIQGLYQLQLA